MEISPDGEPLARCNRHGTYNPYKNGKCPGCQKDEHERLHAVAREKHELRKLKVNVPDGIAPISVGDSFQVTVEQHDFHKTFTVSAERYEGGYLYFDLHDGLQQFLNDEVMEEITRALSVRTLSVVRWNVYE